MLNIKGGGKIDFSPECQLGNKALGYKGKEGGMIHWFHVLDHKFVESCWGSLYGLKKKFFKSGKDFMSDSQKSRFSQ